MSHEIVRPTGWPRPHGYSHGVMASGRVLAVAGQVGWDVECKLVAGGFSAQFEQALTNVRAVVEAAGGRPEHLISLTIYVADVREYETELPEVGRRYRGVLGHHYPAMALVQVARLLEKGARVEIQALAVIPDGGGTEEEP